MAAVRELLSGLAILVALVAAGCAQVAQRERPNLGGSSWQLVKFVDGDGKVLTPDDKTKYTVKDGRLFLALMADGGTYEFEPAATR